MRPARKGNNSGSKKSRVKVENLQQQEKKLKNHEAQRVRGGGGARAGVDMILGSDSAVQKATTGEETPSL